MKDRICIKLLNVIILCMLCNMAKGQTKEMLNCPSPEVSSLQMFNNVPVGNYTGTPNITVPLYTVSLTDKVQIPIQAQYHLANVKPHTPPSTLGVGWALSAGGYITRKVNGIPDETINGFSKNHPKKGFYYNYQEGKFLLESNSLQSTKEMGEKLANYAINYLDPLDNYELSADEFTFDFCGHSGTFFIDLNGKWQVNSEDDIRVEFDDKTGFGSISELGKRFRNLSYYDGYQRNSQFFKEFTLITPDGTRWTFGGEHAIEYSIPYYNQINGDLIATSWRLKQITTITGEKAEFEYEDDYLVCDIHYSPQYSYSHCDREAVAKYQDRFDSGFWGKIAILAFGPVGLVADPFLDGVYSNYDSPNYNFGRAALTGTLTMPTRLVRIKTDNDVVDLSYRKSYEGHRYLDQFGSLFWRKDKNMRMGMYTIDDLRFPVERADRFFLFTDPKNISDSSSDNKIRESIAYSLVNYLLDSIVVSGQSNFEIAFVWDWTGNVRLMNEIRFCSPTSARMSLGNLTNALSRIEENMISQGVPLRDNMIITSGRKDSCSNQIVYKYKFDYWNYNDKCLWPQYRPLTYTDSWGYYTISSSGYWQPSRQYNAKDFQVIPPSLEYAKAHTLKRIYFPSGVYADFNYELNDYSKVYVRKGVFCGLKETNYPCKVGGLRVRSIRYYDPNSYTGYEKKYCYDDNGVSSGILNQEISLSDTLDVSSIMKNSYQRIFSFNHIYNQQIGMNNPIVGYSSVIEETRDLGGNLLERIRCRYTNYDTLGENCHDDEMAYLLLNCTDASTTIPYTTYSFERGKLLSREVLDSKDSVLTRTSYKYKWSIGKMCPIVSQDVVRIPYYEYTFITCRCFVYNYPVYHYLLCSEKEEVKYGNSFVSKTKEYKYDNKNMLSEIYTSNGYMWEREKFDYSYNYACYEWMNKYNIILPVIHTTERDGMSVKEVSGISNVGRIPYVKSKKRITKYGADAKECEELLFDVKAVDECALPYAISEKGVHTYVEWDQALRKPVLIETGGIITDYVNRKENRCLSDIFPNVITTKCQYNRGKLSSKEMPNGVVYGYYYDNMGRLVKQTEALPNERPYVLKKYGYYYNTQELE